jgi:hypothetical protein
MGYVSHEKTTIKPIQSVSGSGVRWNGPDYSKIEHLKNSNYPNKKLGFDINLSFWIHLDFIKFYLLKIIFPVLFKVSDFRL